MESRPFLTYLSLPTVQIWWKIIGGLTFEKLFGLNHLQQIQNVDKIIEFIREKSVC